MAAIYLWYLKLWLRFKKKKKENKQRNQKRHPRRWILCLRVILIVPLHCLHSCFSVSFVCVHAKVHNHLHMSQQLQQPPTYVLTTANVDPFHFPGVQGRRLATAKAGDKLSSPENWKCKAKQSFIPRNRNLLLLHLCGPVAWQLVSALRACVGVSRHSVTSWGGAGKMKVSQQLVDNHNYSTGLTYYTVRDETDNRWEKNLFCLSGFRCRM